MANNRSIGSLFLFLTLLFLDGCGCGSGGGGGGGGPQPGPTTWESVYRHPTSSNLRAVRCNGPNSVIVAGDATSIFRSDNAGEFWVQLEHLPHSRGGDIVSLDYSGANLEAVGSDSESPTKARAWTAINNVLDFTTIDQNATVSPNLTAYAAVRVVNSTTSYRLTTDGVVEEVVNGVATPLPFNLPAGTWTSIDFRLGATDVGFACGDTYKIYRTTRTLPGTWSNWTAMAVPGTNKRQLNHIQMATATIGFACGNNIAILRSINSGATWVEDVGDITDTRHLHSLHFPVNAAIGYAVGDAGLIARTANGDDPVASTWPGQGFPSTNLPTAPSLRDVHFSNNSIGYAVGDNGLVLRTNDGSTWVRVPTDWPSFPDPPVQFNAVDFSSDGQIGLAAASGGVVMRTLDGGATWVGQNVPLTEDYFGVCIPRNGSGNVAYVCGTNGTILRTANLKVTPADWTPPITVGTGTWGAILFPTTSPATADIVGAVVGTSGSLAFTTTGTGWTTSTAPATNTGDWLALTANTAGTALYASGSGSKVAVSVNVGNSWTDFSPALGGGLLLNAVQAPGTVVYAAAGDGSVRKFSASWGTTGALPAGVPVGMSFPDPLNGWTVNSPAPFTGGVSFTTDGGGTWARSYVHTKNQLRAVWMSPTVPGLGYVVGDNGTILRTQSGGQ